MGTSRPSWRSRQSRQTKEFIFSELVSNLYSRGNEYTLCRSRQSRQTKECIFSELLSNLYSSGNEKTLLEESTEQADQGVHLLRAAVQTVLAWERADTPGGVGRAGRPTSSSSQSCCPTCTRVGSRRHSCRSRQSRHNGATSCCFSDLLSNLYLRGNEKTLLEESAEQADQGVHLLRAAVQSVLAWE